MILFCFTFYNELSLCTINSVFTIMQRIFFAFFIFLFSVSALSAQNDEKDTLREVNGLWSIRALKEVTKDYPAAHKLIRQAGVYNGIGMACAYTGGFILAYQLTEAFVDGVTPHWGWSVAGLGLVAMSAPMYIMCNKRIFAGIDLYYIEKENREKSASLQLGFNPGGFGFRLNF